MTLTCRTMLICCLMLLIAIFTVNASSGNAIEQFIAGSFVEISKNNSIDHFISQTRDSLKEMCRNITTGRPKYIERRYNLTDTLNVQYRTIKLEQFRIRTSTNMEVVADSHRSYMFISCCDEIPGFFLAIHHDKHRAPSINACINAMVSKPTMSGTDTMFLIHHILSEIGVESCSLRNCAKLHYKYVANPNITLIMHRMSVPLIVVRCIRGQTSDWYSDFGYFNQQRQAIASEMRRIHDSPCGNVSFGPWLLTLWDKSDKTGFHHAYQNNLMEFGRLLQLRDSSKWTAEIDHQMTKT